MLKFAKFVKPALIALLAFAANAGPAHAADEVKLLKVNSVYSNYRGYWHRGGFEAVVANLAYAKQVSIHYKKLDGTWGDFALAYNRPASAGKEVWSANFQNTSSGLNTLPDAADPVEFVVKYQANGYTYWDNNGGANYKINRDGGTILFGTNVYDAYLSSAYASTGTLTGSVTVKNIAPSKDVEVQYSTDNWATTQVAKATYSASFWTNSYSLTANPNAYGFEEWSYTLNVGSANSVAYRVKYTVNGQTYWDNNFGRNYVTQLLR